MVPCAPLLTLSSGLCGSFIVTSSSSRISHFTSFSCLLQKMDVAFVSAYWKLSNC